MRRDSANRLIDELESKSLLAPDICQELRHYAAALTSFVTADKIAKALTEHGQLTRIQVDILLSALRTETRAQSQQFVEQLDSKAGLDATVVDELRRDVMYNISDKSPESIAEFLVEFGHLTTAEAIRLLTVLYSKPQPNTAPMSSKPKSPTIRFTCPKCTAMHRVRYVAAGRNVSCLKCSTPITVPRPGDNWLRKRCSECGTEHDWRHKDVCDACRGPAVGMSAWCVLHRRLLSESICLECVASFIGPALLTPLLVTNDSASIPPAPKFVPKVVAPPTSEPDSAQPAVETTNDSASPLKTVSTPTAPYSRLSTPSPPSPPPPTVADTREPLEVRPGTAKSACVPVPAASSAAAALAPSASLPLQKEAEHVPADGGGKRLDALPDYERLGSFYLGRQFDLPSRQPTKEKFLYDSDALISHAMCMGMAGSGKRGLCITLLEEAAIDGIPIIALDHKGDLGNLLLTFPQLAPNDFKSWIKPWKATSQGMDIDQCANITATKWREGLAAWDQSPARIARYRDAVEMAIYTPASSTGIPLTVLRSFRAPQQAVINDADLFRERVLGVVSALLTLIGIESNPINREHVLLSHIFDHVWRKAQSPDLATVIRLIQDPPVNRIGLFDVETIFPRADRGKLALRLNNFCASPANAKWIEGESLDVKSLMYTSSGKPRLSVISTAHLNDTERMFFVTILLNELLSWSSAQSPTRSLRAIFFLDEISEFLPSYGSAPSEAPMRKLLNRAGQSGLGIVMATQNPIELDYGGLSKIGTWFIGRLQARLDKACVLNRLAELAKESGAKFDRGSFEQTLTALDSRVFLMKNFHCEHHTLFQTRWALSFLTGTLSREQIKKLMEPSKAISSSAPALGTSTVSASSSPVLSGVSSIIQTKKTRPLLPQGVTERFWISELPPSSSAKLEYRPAIYAEFSCHYIRASANVNCMQHGSLLVWADQCNGADLWSNAQRLSLTQVEHSQQPSDNFSFAELPPLLSNPQQYETWTGELVYHLSRRWSLKLFFCKELKQTSQPGQDEIDARASWTQTLREQRDAERSKLRERYSKLLSALVSKIHAAEKRVELENAEYAAALEQSTQAALLDDTKSGLSNTLQLSTADELRKTSAQELWDSSQARHLLNSLLREKTDLESQFTAELSSLRSRFSMEPLTLEPVEVLCRREDVSVALLCLLWVPYEICPSTTPTPLVVLPQFD